MLLPYKGSKEENKTVLDQRQTQLPRLQGAGFEGWKRIPKTDTTFSIQGQDYVWYRDGNIYKWDPSSQSPNTNQKYVMSGSFQNWTGVVNKIGLSRLL
jgi:hypothetical protein